MLKFFFKKAQLHGSEFNLLKKNMIFHVKKQDLDANSYQ